ncbi:MAG: hypothetical protein ABGY71_12400, partial [bacterium]
MSTSAAQDLSSALRPSSLSVPSLEAHMSLIRLSSIVVLLLAGTAITVKEYIESLSVQPLPAQAVEHEHAGREICPRHQE